MALANDSFTQTFALIFSDEESLLKAKGMLKSQFDVKNEVFTLKTSAVVKDMCLPTNDSRFLDYYAGLTLSSDKDGFMFSSRNKVLLVLQKDKFTSNITSFKSVSFANVPNLGDKYLDFKKKFQQGNFTVVAVGDQAALKKELDTFCTAVQVYRSITCYSKYDVDYFGKYFFQGFRHLISTNRANLYEKGYEEFVILFPVKNFKDLQPKLGGIQIPVFLSAKNKVDVSVTNQTILNRLVMEKHVKDSQNVSFIFDLNPMNSGIKTDFIQNHCTFLSESLKNCKYSIAVSNSPLSLEFVLNIVPSKEVTNDVNDTKVNLFTLIFSTLQMLHAHIYNGTPLSFLRFDSHPKEGGSKFMSFTDKDPLNPFQIEGVFHEGTVKASDEAKDTLDEWFNQLMVDKLFVPHSEDKAKELKQETKQQTSSFKPASSSEDQKDTSKGTDIAPLNAPLVTKKSRRKEKKKEGEVATEEKDKEETNKQKVIVKVAPNVQPKREGQRKFI